MQASSPDAIRSRQLNTRLRVWMMAEAHKFAHVSPTVRLLLSSPSSAIYAAGLTRSDPAHSQTHTRRHMWYCDGWHYTKWRKFQRCTHCTAAERTINNRLVKSLCVAQEMSVVVYVRRETVCFAGWCLYGKRRRNSPFYSSHYGKLRGCVIFVGRWWRRRRRRRPPHVCRRRTSLPGECQTTRQNDFVIVLIICCRANNDCVHYTCMSIGPVVCGTLCCWSILRLIRLGLRAADVLSKWFRLFLLFAKSQISCIASDSCYIIVASL